MMRTKNIITLLLLLCCNGAEARTQARAQKYVSAGLMYAAQLGFAYNAYQKGNYKALYPLSEDHVNRLYEDWDNEMRQAICRNTKPFVPNWLASKQYDSHTSDPQASLTYLKRCISSSITPLLATGLGVCMPAAFFTRAMCAVKHISLLPLFMARSSCLLIFNGTVACSDFETLNKTARPYKDRVYHACASHIHSNPELCNGLISAYCRVNDNNTTVNRYMNPHHREFIPIHIGSYTAHVDHRFVQQCIRAGNGEYVRTDKIGKYIQRVYKNPQQPLHPSTPHLSKTSPSNRIIEEMS